MAESVVVVLVLMDDQDAVDARGDHLQECVLGMVGIAGQADALVEPANRELIGVTGQLAGGRLDHERGTKDMEDIRPGV